MPTAPGLSGGHRGAAAGLLAVAVCLAGSACTSDSTGEGDKPHRRPPSSTAASPGVDAAKRQVLNAYAGMRREQVKTYAAATAVHTGLKRYAYDKALGKILQELLKMKQSGVVYKGRPKSTLSVTAIDVTASPHRATVSECLDTADWRPVLKKTGRDVSSKQQQRRYTVTGTVRTVGTRWMVTDFEADRGRTC